MMKILIDGQMNLISSMRDKINELDFFERYIKKQEFDEIDFSLLYLYSQAWMFNDSGYGLEDREIKKYTLKFHWSHVQNHIKELTSKGLLEITKKSPNTKKLSKKFINDVVNNDE